MASTYEDWQSGYPSLANLNFGKNSLTGGADLYSGFNGLGRPSGMADLPATNFGGGNAVQPGGGSGGGFNWNMDMMENILGGLQTAGGLYNAFQGNRLARDQFRFSKEFANTNLNNSMQTYNTQLEDRARSRAVVEGQSDAERDAYIAANRLSR